MNDPQFDRQLALDLADIGKRRVIRHAGTDFVDRACELIERVHAGQTVLAEEWRKTCVEHGIVPHHPNAWGALTSALRARGVILKTDERRHARSVRTHGHEYALWKVVDGYL